jgi:thiol-disulfide isomerase/thioredoxin
MKNTTLFIGLGAILVIAGVAYAGMNASEEKAMMVKAAAEKAMMEQKDNEKMLEAEAMKKEEAMKMMEAEATMKKEDSIMEEESMESDSMMKKEVTSMVEGGEMMKTGSYLLYSADKIAMAETGDVVLFFKASWCPSCKAVDTDIKANLKSIPAGLTILEVDYDNSAELKKKYGVTYQHTFVQVDKNGNLIKKWSGSPTLTSLVSEVE